MIYFTCIIFWYKIKEYFLDLFTLTPSPLYIEWVTSILGITATSTCNLPAFHTIRPLYLMLSREWFLVLIQTQELKLRKNFVQFKYSLCVSKKTILDEYCSYVELFTTRLIKLVSKRPVTPWPMHSVAGNVLFYNSWERVSDLKITELNIS